MQEIPFTLLYKTFTLKRFLNAAKGVASYLVSAASKRSFVWGRPFILTAEPTNLCNLKCPLCVTGNGRLTRNAGSMSLAMFKKIMELHGDYLFYLLLYHQGEPFLNKEFLNFVRLAKKKNIFVTTSTNAHYLSPITSEEIVKSGLDSMIISVDGTSQASYENYRIGGDFEKVIDGIRRLINARNQTRSLTPVIFLQFIVMQHNEHEIERVKKLGRDLGVDKVLIKTVQVETAHEAKKWLPQNALHSRYNASASTLTPKRRGKGPCPRPWTSTLINWNGVSSPCCFDKNATHRVGGVDRDSTLKDSWNSEAYASFRKRMLTDRSSLDICNNCSQGLKRYL